MDPSLEIQITSSELRQVILNLVNNAIQALSNSATINPLISIDASQHSGTVQISTTDNGPGISKENQANLFEILISTKQSGMGLGLWLCQYMITRHGGSIHYEDALGGGARFVIEIPHSAWWEWHVVSPKANRLISPRNLYWFSLSEINYV